MSLTGAKAVVKYATARTITDSYGVSEYSTDLIAQAIQSEMARGGQVYSHNHEGIGSDAIGVGIHCPDCRVRCAHGQMSAAELDDVMLTFYNHDCDVLLCTTIIENGLDVSNVNTVIINRADRLGLSQIHQIRGRVGRSNRQAYAYVLYPKEAALSDESKARLQVLKEAVGLGVGYQLAMKDLEIRGAGTLLGEKQSGHLTAIGFDLYCKLLDQNLQAVRGMTPADDAMISLKNAPNVFIPSSYIDDDQQRLACIRFLAVKTPIHLKKLQLRWDRFEKFRSNWMRLWRRFIE